MINKARIKLLAEERINELDNGLFIVDISVSSRNDISVEIDKYDGGVSVQDCISVSRNIEHSLDREQGDFSLNVSSAGLDRGLRVFDQYRKNVGRNIKLILNAGGKFEGELKEATKDEVVIRTTRNERVEGKKKKERIIEDIKVPMADIKEAKIVISFK